MIPRYTRPEIGAVWTPQAKLESWLEVELAATEAWAAEGVVPEEAAREARAKAAFTVEAVDEREKVTDHDVAAFVDVVAASVGEHGRWIHYGLTSSDVLDTALAVQLQRAGEIVLASARGYRTPWSSGRSNTATRSASAAPTASTPSRPPSGCGWPASPSRPIATSAGSRRRSPSCASASSPARSAPTPRSRPRSRRG